MSTGPQDPDQPQQPPPQPPPPPQQPWQGGPPPQPGHPPAGQPPMGRPPQPPMRPDDEKLWAIAAHLGPLVLGFVAPLVVWLVFRERSQYLDRQGKEALNFQITLLLVVLVSIPLWLVIVGILVTIVAWVGGIVLMIVAAVKVSQFEDYRYPVNIRFLS